MAPNAALRWTPSAENIAPEYREGPATASGGASATAKGAQTNDVPSNRRLLWTAEGQYVRPIPVCAGLTDGVLTEVKGEGAQEGMEVVLGMQTSSASGSSSASSASGTSSSAPSGATTNPFTPKMPKPPKGARGGPPL
jgi:hypothetical protein